MPTIALESVIGSPVRAIKYVGAGAILVLLAACGGSSLDSSPADTAGTAAQRSNVPGVSAAQYANSFVTRRGAARNCWWQDRIFGSRARTLSIWG